VRVDPLYCTPFFETDDIYTYTFFDVLLWCNLCDWMICVYDDMYMLLYFLYDTCY
jgi:hypothetical protein